MTQKAFITLVRLGIGHNADPFPDNVDWSSIENLAAKQGLSAIVLDGIERLPDNSKPPKELLLQWIGNTLQSYEYRYEMYRRAIAELAEWHNSNGYKMMVLKGYGCSINWPKPYHRPCGDIDIWQFGIQKKADEILKSNGIKVDNSHHHHTVFQWKGFSVENHYDFINVHHHKSNIELERILKRLGEDDSNWIDVNGNKVYLPSANLHALFLLKHMMADFAATILTLRQLLDWAFFVKKHSKEIDWGWLESILEKYGMNRMYDVFKAICVGDLGFDVSIFPNVVFDTELKEKVLKEILNPKYSNAQPKQFFPRLVWKWRRWKANSWKHKLIYKESLWSAFWSGVWSHILRPASF